MWPKTMLGPLGTRNMSCRETRTPHETTSYFNVSCLYFMDNKSIVKGDKKSFTLLINIRHLCTTRYQQEQ